jgi:hypothetical protein
MSPLGVSFGNQPLSSASNPAAFYLYSTGTADLAVSSIQTTGDFTQTNNCGTVVAVNTSCQINVTFQPTATGTHNGTLTVTTNANRAIPASTLSGVGIVSAGSFSPSPVTFAPLLVGSTSAAQQVTLTNVSSTAFSIFGFSITGDFSQTNNCPSALYPNASCTINVTFHPTARGTRAGTLSLNSNAPGSMPTVNLSGTGQQVLASASPNTIAFGSQDLNMPSAAQFVTFTNTGDLLVNISSVSIAGDFSQTNNCASPIPVGASCNFNITFTPKSTGSRSGTLTINGNFQSSPAVVSLSGTGVTPGASFAPTSLSFGSQRVGTSGAAKNVTLTNTGSGPLLISRFTVTGDYSQTNNCATSLAARTSCTISILFTPAARGNRNGTVTLNSNAPGSAPTVSLTGTGVAPVASLSPTSLNFNNQLVSTTSGQKGVNLTNSGDFTMNISSISITGDFAQTNNCSATLAPGAHCTINVTFKPTTTGTRNGTLLVNDDASNGVQQTTTLTGTGK